MNRRLIWPPYEIKVRRKLMTAGDPAGLKPEEILGLQEMVPWSASRCSDCW